MEKSLTFSVLFLEHVLFLEQAEETIFHFSFRISYFVKRKSRVMGNNEEVGALNDIFAHIFKFHYMLNIKGFYDDVTIDRKWFKTNTTNALWSHKRFLVFYISKNGKLTITRTKWDNKIY